AAFAPLLTWTGIMGEFMVYMPLTVVVVLLSSLFVALFILPVLTAIGLRPKPQAKQAAVVRYGFVLRAYRASLAWSLRHRVVTSLGTVALFVVTFMAYGALQHGTEFFPDSDPDRATITVRAADGTDVEETDRIVRQIEEVLIEDPSVETY